MTQNTAHPHFDHHYAAQTAFGRPTVNSCLTLALVTGQSVTDVSQNVVANPGWDEVRMPHPLSEGDTVYSRSEVPALRPLRSREGTGLVTVRTTGHTQEGTVVITFTRPLLVYRRGHGPTSARPSVVPERRRPPDAGPRRDHRWCASSRPSSCWPRGRPTCRHRGMG